MLEILVLELETLEEARELMLNKHEDSRDKMITINNAFKKPIMDKIKEIKANLLEE